MKYEVDLDGYLPQTATIVIEADSEEEAEEIALEIAEEEPWIIPWNDCDYSCRRNEVVDAYEYHGEDEELNIEKDD